MSTKLVINKFYVRINGAITPLLSNYEILASNNDVDGLVINKGNRQNLSSSDKFNEQVVEDSITDFLTSFRSLFHVDDVEIKHWLKKPFSKVQERLEIPERSFVSHEPRSFFTGPRKVAAS